MAILPVSLASSSQSGTLPTSSSSSSGASSRPFGGRRALRPPSWRALFRRMDFELAAWQLTYLCVAPRRVYRNVYYHKQTKNRWARDDLAVPVLMSLALCVCAALWGIRYSLGWSGTLLLALRMVLLDFLAVGLVISTALWALANALLVHSPHSHSSAGASSRVEWAYAFDVHANGFFPFLLLLYLAQLFLSPLLTRPEWVCLFLGNTLYLIAILQYIYITFLGFNALPFLIRSEVLLLPGLLAIGGYVLSLLGLNVARATLRWYFGLGA